MDREKEEHEAGVTVLAEIRAKVKAGLKILSNYTLTDERGRNKQQFKVPDTAVAVGKRIEALIGQPVKSINKSCFILADNKVHMFDKCVDLFAYFSGLGIVINWAKTEGMILKDEFFSSVKFSGHSYSYITDAPHVPTLPEVFYVPRKRQPSGFKLHELISMFSPYSEKDARLLLCAMVTPMWGGPGGSRPLFVFDGDEKDEQGGRGIGKSKFSETIAEIYGGAVELNLQMTDADEKIKRRLLDATHQRIVRFDNVKTSCADSQILEHLITAPTISGHKIYQGLASKPNYFTYLMTFNGASLSKDLAKRAIPIKLKRPVYTAGWEEKLHTMRTKHRYEILDEIQEILEAKTPAYPIHTRFSHWEQEVAQKVFMCELVGEYALEGSQNAIDADDEQAASVRECFYASLSKLEITNGFGSTPINPDETCLLISKQVAAEWVREWLHLPRVSFKAINTIITRAKIDKIEGTILHRGLTFWVWNRGEHPSGYRVADAHLTFLGEKHCHKFIQ